MKKNNLILGILYMLFGICFFVIQAMFDTGLDSILLGLAATGIVSGSTIVWKYFYWSRPENKERYQEKLEEEKIHLQDERKEKLRDKSGRYGYILGLIILLISIMVFSILGSMNIIENASFFVIYLSVFFLFQYCIGIFIYGYLSKKY